MKPRKKGTDVEALPIEDTRVADAWAREERRELSRAKARDERKALDALGDGGVDGAVLVDASVKVTPTRYESRVLRARPGTFDWRYGRKTANSALYHAGVKFADLWERAGTAAASSPNMAFTGSAQWKGIGDARVEAMSEIDALRKEIGKWSTARLVDYCVMGTPASDIAAKYNSDERAMSFVLMEDLKACASAFRLI